MNQNQMDQEKLNIPTFTSLREDPDEDLAVNEELRGILHQLGYLTRSDVVEWKSNAASKKKLGHWFKLLMEKMTFFLFTLLIKQQNDVNLQTESLLRRSILYMNHLEKENMELKERLERLEHAVLEKGAEDNA